MNKAFWALAAAAVFSSALFAQTSRGTVTGLVTDPSVASVATATVDLKNVDTGVVRTTSTNESGLYRLEAIDPGSYEISISKPGFKGTRSNPFVVAAAQVASIDARLEVGAQQSIVEVTADAVALQVDSPVRSSTITSQQITELPFANRNPVYLALTVPGVSTSRFGVGAAASFSVNGSRSRSNNFLIDGTENNDISVAGQGFTMTLPDLVQETNIQTSNYDAEFGRAAGAVVNVITKSGTNNFHGTASWLLDVTNDDAVTNQQSLDPEVQKRGKPLPGTENIWAGTLGGAIIRNKTFFFGGFQEDRQKSSGSATAAAPTAAGWATLNSLFPSGANPRVDLYRQVLAGTTATAQPALSALGNGRPDVEFGTATLGFASFAGDRLYSARVDHKISDSDLLSGRYSQQSRPFKPASLSYPGMNTNQSNNYKNAVLSETHIFSAAATNELRLGYNRIDLSFPIDTVNPRGSTLPNYFIAGLPPAVVAQLGVLSNFPQGRIANNYTIQDTFSLVRGRHTLRMGMDLLNQRSRQLAPINERGSFTYQASNIAVNGVTQAFSGFANFVDDFSGSTGTAARDFGAPAYYPSLYRQQYFFTDRWRVSQALTLTLGLRYENFGVPINSIRTSAYSGLFNVNPVTLDGPWNKPSSVDSDNNNFGPSVGLAYSPSVTEGLLGKLLGDRKSVIRTGYQIGFDSFYNNMASSAATSSPNVNSVSSSFPISITNPRGQANFSAQLPQPRTLSPNTTQGLAVKNLVNPYTQKWSFGFQREMPFSTLLDLAYVGSKGTKLYMTEDLNPLVPASLQVLPQGYTTATLPINSLRLDPLQGSRSIRTNGASSYYHSLQVNANRRLASHLAGTVAYTWSKNIDYAGDPYNQTSGLAIPAGAAVPTVFGGLAREKAVSLFDRPHRFVVSAVYQIPFLLKRNDFAGRVLGGWQLSGIYTIESGVPFTVLNGIDADGIGGNLDRPDVNPNGRAGVRAVPQNSSPTGYVNPDAGGAPIDRATARYVVLPANSGRTGNGGRNTERTPGQNNIDANIHKVFGITEGLKLEFRTEIYNLFNHPQLGTPSISPFSPTSGTITSSAGGAAAGRFMNFNAFDGGGRVFRYQLKFMF
ncbi:MAG: TonB-dependent Receptor Plug Domain protein [Bryobacterales bacterium]|nr:TonB-dependent Receptor Plug Domain protein [Bryobacterales bacterium]